MPRIPFEGFCGPSYLAASPVLDAQRAINLFPEPGYKTSKSPMGMIGRPGLSLFSNAINSPCRCLWAGNNRLFTVGGTHVYEMRSDGTQLNDYGAAFGSAGTGPAQLVHNGSQMLLCDPSTPAIYYVNPIGPAVTFVFNGKALEYLDGFFVSLAFGVALAGSNPNQINVSALNDGGTWPALNYAIRTSAADLLTQLATLNGLLWAFGQKTITVYYNAGNAGFPFARVNGGDINLGLLAPQTVVKFYNSLLWLGADDRGYAQVYMAQGLNPVRVSNFAIEQYLSTFPVFYLQNATAYGYQENGHTFYCLNLTNAATQVPVGTLVYDLTTGLWHERTYLDTNAWPSCAVSLAGFQTAGRAAASVPNFVGDAYHGRIYYQGCTYPSDDGQPILYIRTAPHANERGEWVRYGRLELDGDFGSAQPFLEYSNDGGRTFPLPTAGPRAMQQATDYGAIGTYQRYYALQLGRSRDRVFRVRIQDNSNLIRIAGAWLEAEGE